MLKKQKRNNKRKKTGGKITSWSSPALEKKKEMEMEIEVKPKTQLQTTTSSSSSSSGQEKPSAKEMEMNKKDELEKETDQEVKPKAKTVMIPGFTKLFKNRRFEIDRKGEMFFIIPEKKLKHLDDFLAQRWEDDCETGHGVYLNGVEGVGKTYCLYYKAWEFSKDPNYRVAYIPDCGATTISPFSRLLQVW